MVQRRSLVGHDVPALYGELAHLLPEPVGLPETWVDTGTVDRQPCQRVERYALGQRQALYRIHVKASSNTAVVAGQPSRLYRYSYNATTRTYSLDTGFPTNINDTSSETLTLDRDSSGGVWATWTQQKQVFVDRNDHERPWGTPCVPSLEDTTKVANTTNLDADDISSIVAFREGIGVMLDTSPPPRCTSAFHRNGDPAKTWQQAERTTVSGAGQADDHINVKELQTDEPAASGR